MLGRKSGNEKMKKTFSCPKCGSLNDDSARFCISCGEKLERSCPNCKIAIKPEFQFCPRCGRGLGKAPQYETKAYDVPKSNDISNSDETPEKLVDLLESLHMIGVFQQGIPFDQRELCNVLGIYVQYKHLDKYSHGIDGVWMKAGSKRNMRIEAWTSYRRKWEIKKYKPGTWEALVKPTLQISKWLYDRGGLQIEDREAFNKAVKTYKKEGVLKLP